MPQMKPLNHRLQDLAHRVCNEFRNDPRVDAIMLTGSVAIGCSDRGSDLDLILYLNQPLSAEEFEGHKQLANGSGGGFYFGTAEEGFAVYRRVGGVKVDLGFGTTAETEALLHAVLVHHDTDVVKHQVIAGLLESVSMHGAERLEEWRQRVLPMPRGLQMKLLAENVRITPLSILESMAAARGDRPFHCETVLNVQTRLLKLLYTLEGRYYPGKLKGIHYRLAVLEQAPALLHERFCHQLAGPMEEAVADLGNLVPGILGRVREAFPDVDTESALEFFRGDIRQWA